MDWASWTGLEHWFYFNHIGHYFNTSPQLPNFVHLIAGIITYIQVIPILSSIMVFDAKLSPIIEGLKVLFRVFVYLNFIPEKHFAVISLVIMLLIALFFIFVSQINTGRLLQNEMAFSLRFLTEIITPIFFVWTGALVQRLGKVYLIYGTDLPFMIIAVIAAFGYLFIYLIVSFFESRTIFLRYHLFETWNTSFNCFLIVGAVLYMQTWIFSVKFPNIGIYIVLAIGLFVNLLLFISILHLPYMQSIVNTNATIIILYLVLLHLLFFFCYAYYGVSPIIYNGIAVFLILLSILIGPILQNAMVRVFLRTSAASDDSDSKFSDETNINLELEEIDQNNSSPNEELSQNEKNKKIEEKEDNFINSGYDVIKLRQLFLADHRRAERFATFLLNTSSKINDIMESFRILTILRNPPTHRINELTLTRFDCHQLLCDLQYEAIARDFSDSSIEELLSHLESKELVIKRNLSAIADSIQLTNKLETFSFIQNYSKECTEYEMMASFILVHAPYSSAITQHLVTYFNNLRGDMEQSQTWIQNTDGLRKSASFSGYRSRLSVNVSSTRINELGGIQRLNSQRALQRVHSNALRGSMLFYFFALISAIICALYKYNPSTVEYITSEIVSKATIQLSTFAIAPLFSLFELMSSVLSDCSPSNAKKFENLFNHVIIPFNSGVNQILTALELISEALKIVDRNFEKDINGYYSFSKDLITEDNISLQLLMNQIHKISEVAPKGQCYFKYLQLINEFDQKICYCSDPLQNLKQILTNCSILSVERFANGHLRDFCILIVFLFVLLSIAFFYIQIITIQERNKFWTEFSELDGSELEKFQKQLLVVNDKVDTQPSIEDPNLLSPDEIEAPETERLILTNELLPLGRLKRAFNFFPLATVLFFVVFGVTMFCYKLPIMTTLDIDMKLDAVSHSLQTVITKHTFKVIDYTYKALFTVIPISSRLFEENEIEDDFPSGYINEYTFKLQGIHKNELKYKLNNEPRGEFKNEFRNKPKGELNNAKKDEFKSKHKNKLEEEIENEIKNRRSDSPYDFYDFTEVLKQHSSYFKDASDFQTQLENVTAASLKYGEDWQIFQLDDNFFNMVWLAFHNVTGLSNQISEWYFEKHAKLNMMRTLSSHVMSTFLAVVLGAYGIFVVHQLKLYHLEFESLKALIIILPSQYYGSTANIIDSFKPRVTKKVGTKRFRSRYIIKHSVNSIIVIDSNRLIQDVNKATIELFGYKRDYLIRTDLMTLFLANDHQSDDFFAQLTFMNRQNATNLPLREFNLNALTMEGEPLPVNCTLIPIGSPESTDSPAFAVLLRDRSEFLKQDILYRNMQHQVESLLLRIMPKVMVMKLLAKNQILHSQVNHATFMFIGIVNFPDWCKMHTHTEIMELLDIIVSAFDKKISKYLSLVKIKIINGVYMAAGGLFEEVSVKPHEVEMVEFAIKCVRWIQNRNRLTSSSLKLQIGIHTGGPIIAGILGHDKPFFDVYGDAVNVAARLETSAEHGRIQISQEMKSALPEGMFCLQERKHVFLKGKGDATTYQIVIPDVELPKEKQLV